MQNLYIRFNQIKDDFIENEFTLMENIKLIDLSNNLMTEIQVRWKSIVFSYMYEACNYVHMK